MIINLFEIPIFIGNIDIKKIKLNNKNFEKTWISQTPSTFKQSQTDKSMIENEVTEYLLKEIVKLLEEKIKYAFEIRLLNIWENIYQNNDYQEPHIHSDSDFSFVIYKKVEEGKTVFLNPIRNYLMIYKNINHMFQENFMPKCKSGQIVIFPSFLEHMVLKSSNQSTISGNIFFKKL
jgi:hypothetical protein